MRCAVREGEGEVSREDAEEMCGLGLDGVWDRGRAPRPDEQTPAPPHTYLLYWLPCGYAGERPQWIWSTNPEEALRLARERIRPRQTTTVGGRRLGDGLVG